MSAHSIDDLLKDIPPSLLDQQCSDIYLAKVSRQLINWKLLSPFLRISAGEQHSIMESCRDYDEQKQRLLYKWKENQASAATHCALIGAIHESGNNDLAHNACELLRQQSSQIREGACSTVSVLSPTIAKYQSQLKYGYRTQVPVMMIDWPPPPALKYISLTLIKKEVVQRGEIKDELIRASMCGAMADINPNEVEVELEQLLSLDSNERKVILFEGAPGSGKSTLLWHICQKWQSGELFQQFSLVLLVLLRDTAARNAQCLADILPYLPSRTSKSSEIRANIASEIEDSQGEGILIMLDGWDEAPVKLRQKGSFFHNIVSAPSEYSIMKADILVSSRPSASRSLGTYLSSRVGVMGFTKESRELYIRETLNDNAQKFIEEIESVGDELNLSLPLTVVILTHNFISSDYKLPSSFCRMIITLALSCLLRHIRKTQPDGDSVEKLQSLGNLPEGTRDSFLKLCQIAYEGIVNEKYSFTSEDLKEMTELPSRQITTLGLLQSVHSLVATGSSTVYHFLHFSLLELCAAYYVANLPDPESKHVEALKKILIPTFKPTKKTQEGCYFESVSEFYSALTGLKSLAVARQLKNAYFIYDIIAPLQIQQRIIAEDDYDSDTESMERGSQYSSEDESMQLGSEDDADRESMEIGDNDYERFKLFMDSYVWNEGVYLKSMYVNNYIIKSENGNYCKDTCTSFLTCLVEAENPDVVDDTFGKDVSLLVHETVDYELAGVIRLAPSLESVTCYGHSRKVYNALCGKQHLKKLEVHCIFECIDNYADFECVLEIFRTCPNLKDIKIKARFSDSVADIVASQLSSILKHKSLDNFEIDVQNGMKDTGIAILAPALGSMSTITIRSEQVGPCGLEKLADTFSQTCSLTYLIIDAGQYLVTAGSDRIFFNCLKKAQLLKTVIMQCKSGEPSLSDTSVGKALLTGDLIELADILGLNTPPRVDKTMDLHICNNAYIKVDFATSSFISIGLISHQYKHHFYSSHEDKEVIMKCKVGPSEIEKLSETLKQVTVKELNLSTHKIGDEGARYLGKEIGTIMCLEELIIHHCGIGEDGIASLFSGLTSNTTLVRLDVCMNAFGDNGAIRLAEMINQTALQTLDISSCGLEERGIVALALALRSNTTLKKLNLYSQSEISQRSEMELARTLLRNIILVGLGVNQNKRHFPPLFHIDDYDLRRFKVTKTSTSIIINDTSPCIFYAGVKNSPIIASIEIDSTTSLGQALWAGNMEEAAEILQLHQPPVVDKTLTIHMSGNTWTVNYRTKHIQESDKGLVNARSICNNPESWSQLTELNFKLETLGDVGASLLAEVLNKTQLEELNISGCGIGEEGIVALASALRTNTTLKYLAIGGNQITEHGQSVLADALVENKTLETLDTQARVTRVPYEKLFVSFVGDNETFVQSLAQSFSLKKLYMDGHTLFGAHLEEQHIRDEWNRTRRYYHNVNTIECELKPFRVSKIFRSSTPDKILYNASS